MQNDALRKRPPRRDARRARGARDSRAAAPAACAIATLSIARSTRGRAAKFARAATAECILWFRTKNPCRLAPPRAQDGAPPRFPTHEDHLHDRSGLRHVGGAEEDGGGGH